ncbi:MAG: hypothetical protein JNK60_21585 [Acidobacteria bacterium]|nr:hypothetical protein [Acidobacteriota bacterium]
MALKSTSKAAAPGTRAAPKTQVRPARKAAPKPFLRFYFTEKLQAKALGVLDAMERAPDPVKHRDALADVVVELTNAGMAYCFLEPLKKAKAGFLVEQSANLGMSGALQVISSVIRNIIGRMGAPQLLSVCGSIRELMR